MLSYNKKVKTSAVRTRMKRYKKSSGSSKQSVKENHGREPMGIYIVKKKKKNSISKLVAKLISLSALVLLASFLLLLPQHNQYALRAYSEDYQEFPNQQKNRSVIASPHPLPVQTTDVAVPDLSAGGAVVMDIDTEMILYEKNPDTKLFPASTTKIMTALVAFDSYQLDDIVTVKTIVPDTPVMGLISGEMITVENLLYGALIHSANDAAYVLAQHYPTGIDGFVTKMNDKAKELFLTNTHFVNPIGFDDPDQFTTPKDLAKLTSYALKNKTITKIVGYPQITVANSSYTRFHPLKNVNILLGKIPGVSGFKTGFTAAAGECLVTTAQQNGKKVIIVLLGSKDRFGETEALINWVFTNFTWTDVTFKN